MKRLLASFGWILLLLPLISVAGIRTALASMTPDWMDSEIRSVQPFRSVSSSGSFDVHIKLGNQESLRLEGDKETLSRIETVVENGDLKIGYRKNQGWKWKGGKVDVYITAKKLEGLSLSGSGSINVDGIVKATEFTTRLSGSGNMSFKLDNSSLNAALNGSGKIISSGSTKKADIAISGSGGFQGGNLRSQTADIKMSGSGNVRIDASEILNAAVSGSGNIYYSGNPVVNSKISGSGRVARM